MRQIEIGLYPNNIIWVDDNILNPDWENKTLMEIAYYNSKVLKIIPKITTEIMKILVEMLERDWLNFYKIQALDI